MPAISTFVAATLGAASLVEARKGRKDIARAREIEGKASRLQAARGAIEQIRQTQIARASIIQQGENQGVGGSSPVLGGAGSVVSQGGGNIAFAQQLFNLQQSARRLQSSAEQSFGTSKAFGTAAGFAATPKISAAIDKAFI